MHEHPIIHVDPVNNSLCPALLNLGVLPTQWEYMDDLAERHPLARLLVLSVNNSNHAASRLYRRAGFSPPQ